MGKYTVCVATYIVVESDDLDDAYKLGESLRSAVALTVLDGHEYEDQVIGVDLAGVYEIEGDDDVG